jgi:hypothetical protein
MLMNLMTLLLTTAVAAHAAAASAKDVPQRPEDIRYLAMKYEFGYGGVKRDFDQAYRLYCQAYLSGNMRSAYNIGLLHLKALGRERSLRQALFWFRRGAESGDLLARRMTNLYYFVSSEEDTACAPPPPPPAPVAVQAAAEPRREIPDTNRKVVERWVNQIAPRYAIDPRLVIAVIQAESGFNNAARSPKNAQGLMQLIPATAERFGVKNVWNPVDNIRGGTAYLSWLMRYFSGNLEHVLAAYNAGEGAVVKHRGVPPFEETQTYVRRILGYYQKAGRPTAL